jgi:hypothetical protein
MAANAARCAPRLAARALFQREPLRFDAAILLGIRPERLFPTAPDDIKPRRVYVVALDEEALNLARAVLAEINRFERHLSNELLAAPAPKIFDQRIIDVTAQ